MLDLSNKADKQAYSDLFVMAHEERIYNTCFGLAMRNEDGSLSTYGRTSQPCYGEMRKYKSTHGNKCTRPESSRPGDLRHPFPEGIVEAVCTSWKSYLQRNSVSEDLNSFMEFVFSDGSPWIRGFGSSDDVMFVNDPHGNHTGIVSTNTDIDPTVLVSLFTFVRTWSNYALHWNNLVKNGLSKTEATICFLLMGSSNFENYVSLAYSYYFPLYADIKRVVEQNPHDLSDGTWRDGYDYNRKNLHNIFARLQFPRKATGHVYAQDKEKGISFPTRMNEILGRKLYTFYPRADKVSIEDFVKAAKIVIEEGIKKSERYDEEEAKEEKPEVKTKVKMSFHEVHRDKNGRFAKKAA